MKPVTYKPETECTQVELLRWRWACVAGWGISAALAAAGVLFVLGVIASFPTWILFIKVCGVCGAVGGLAARVFIHIPDPVIHQAMRDIKAAGGAPAGERMISIW